MKSVSQIFNKINHHLYFVHLRWYLVAALLVLLFLNFIQYLNYALAAISYPFGLDYSEGLLLWQYQAFLRGDFLQTPLSQYPYIVYNYPPVYYIATYIASIFFTDPLSAGRAISILSTLGISVIVFVLTLLGTPTRSKPARIVGAFCGALLVFSFYPVYYWSKLMRVDMLGVFLNLIGIFLLRLSFQSRKYLYLSVIFFVAAVFTKQTLIAGAVAGLGLALIVWPRAAIRAIGLYVAMGLALLAYMYFTTGGEAFLHLFTYNINSFRLQQGIGLFFDLAKNHLLILGVVIGFALFSARLALGEIYRQKSVRQLLLSDSELFSITLYILYFFCGSAILITVFKVGSNFNYFIESVVVCSLICGILVTRAMSSPNNTDELHEKTRRNAFFFQSEWLLLIFVLQTVVMMYPSPYKWWSMLPSQASTRSSEQVLDLIKSTPGKVLSDDMVLLIKAGKEIPWEPAIMTELTKTGVFDQTKIIKMIAERAFGLIILSSPEYLRDERFTPQVQDAVNRFYHRRHTMGEYEVYAPP